MKKQSIKIFRIHESLNVIDSNERIWVVIKCNTKGVLLTAMEEEPMPNAIVVSAHDFYKKFKEYDIPVRPKKKGKISWEQKRGDGSYFDHKLNRMRIRPFIDTPIKRIKGGQSFSDDDINFSDF